MSLENVANTIVGFIFIFLIAAILICGVLVVYFYFTETPVPPTVEEVQQIEAKYKEERENKASWYCIFFLGAFILGIITGKPQFHGVGLILLFGTLLLDYKTFFLGLLLWYIIIPTIIVMAIVSLFRRS